MIFWMARAARSLSGELRASIDKAAEGSRWSLVVVAILAVGREGLETALFLWAATQAGTREAVGSITPTWQPLTGAALGIATAILLGYLTYRGALAINLTRFFTWTGAFLILVAGGVLSYGVHDLQEAAILPGLHDLAFDVSHVIDPSSGHGTLLKGIFNFSPATTKLEATAWLLYVIPVMALFFWLPRRARRTPPHATQPKEVNA
jgi:high-affinity iron transporter